METAGAPFARHVLGVAPSSPPPSRVPRAPPLSARCPPSIPSSRWRPVSSADLGVDKLSVGIFLFDGVEVLDFAGPFEVFSRTRLAPGPESRRSEETAPFRVFTVAAASDPVVATGDLRVLPHFDFTSAPPIDVLVIPGGFGTRALLDSEPTLAWIRRQA